MTDYESKVHNLFASMSYAASAKLNLFGTVTWNKAESALDKVQMPDLAAISAQTGGDLVDNMDYDFTNLNSYSDLDYTLLKLNGGLSYKVSPTVTFTLDGEYADLTDDQGYVFGNESGSFYMVRSGFKVQF
ncbi:MAG TPA: hypothetical protein ENH23_02225 [candidate division Zixibacteria bacterium]|nr:hypothetical protein [candidate division Zixibacteria bacterium]